MTGLNKYGELEQEDTSCSECGNPLKTEWVACPICGKKIASDYCRIHRSHISPPNRIEQPSFHHNIRQVTEEELAAWAYDSDGLDYNRRNAAIWAQEHLPFFEEHDFDLFKRLAAWAYDSNGLDYNRHNAAIWAKEAVIAVEQGRSVNEVKQAAKQKRSQGGCFISTAIIESLGLPDDCHELTVLRSFRDTFMQKTLLRKQQVNQYYQIAPNIVYSISTHSDVSNIWKELWGAFLKPAIEAIERGDNELAYQMYFRMIDHVSFKVETDDCL